LPFQTTVDEGLEDRYFNYHGRLRQIWQKHSRANYY